MMDQPSAENHRMQALLLASLFFGIQAAQAEELRVPSEYPTIQSGIDAANPGDSVLVAPGNYGDYVVRLLGGFTASANFFLKDGVNVVSEEGPGSTIIEVFQVPSDGVYAGVFGIFLATGPTRVEGFTFQGNDAVGVGIQSTDCMEFSVVNCVFDRLIGGLHALGDVTVIDCSFYACRASIGSGIYHSAGQLDLFGCDFEACEGAAVAVVEAEGYYVRANVVDCRFVENSATEGPAAFWMGPHNGVTIRNTVFFGNSTTTGQGQGTCSIADGPALVEGCRFIRNTSENWTSALELNSSWDPVVRNCTFSGNMRTSSNPYGAISFLIGTTFENNIVAGTRGDLAIHNEYPPFYSSCNVFWDNPVGIGVPLSPTDRVADPLFCDPEADDYRLRSGSPCLPEDPLGCGLIGALGQGCGSVSVESKSWGAIKGLYR